MMCQHCQKNLHELCDGALGRDQIPGDACTCGTCNDPLDAPPAERYELGDDGKCWALFADSEGDTPHLVGVFSEREDAEKLSEGIFEPSILPAIVQSHGTVLIANDFHVADHAGLRAALEAKGLWETTG